MNGTTTIALRFKGATFRAEIDPADVDRMLADVDAIPVAPRDRGGAMTWTLNVLRRNGHLKDQGTQAAMTVLWLICRHPALGPTALTLARKGGGVLAYDVTENPLDVWATRGVNNWRAHVGSRETVVPLLPWLPPADFPT